MPSVSSLLGRKKKKDSGSTFATFDDASSGRPSLVSSQQSDLSLVPDEKVYNPSGRPLGGSPLPETRSVKLESPSSPPPRQPHQQVNVYVNSLPLASEERYTSAYTAKQPLVKETIIGSPQLTTPTCKTCGKHMQYLITRASNRNGNGGRPYYKCQQHNQFLWADDMGESDDNPCCDCNRPSKRQITGAAKGRKFFYTCSTGGCEFFRWHLDEEGNQVQVNEDVAKALRALNIA